MFDAIIILDTEMKTYFCVDFVDFRFLYGFRRAQVLPFPTDMSSIEFITC